MWGEVQRDQSQASESSLPVESTHEGHAESLQLHVVITCVKCCLPKNLIRDLVLRVFIGGWSPRPPQPS